MEFLALMAFAILGAYILKNREQQRRIVLLGSALGKYQIEQLMENLTEGYLRWLDEKDPERWRSNSTVSWPTSRRSRRRWRR
ncbi:MAG: hypothetical protein DI563_04525 [Variovorax paradoxus]|uniref:Uncharacterized protein n=1 Tax=Variovorax paradoxus TaxID=34073 RepID=A0A2W5SR25_VARPD|nr:MAG: hypothetical protein DI563_04525 [Variovorax paradoxus]